MKSTKMYCVANFFWFSCSVGCCLTNLGASMIFVNNDIKHLLAKSSKFSFTNELAYTAAATAAVAVASNNSLCQ